MMQIRKFPPYKQIYFYYFYYKNIAIAKVVAPFKISGTLDDINFVLTENGNNYARMKGKTGVTSEEFKNNPLFDSIRNHAKEWGYCSKKTQLFRQMVAPLFQKAKDESFAGRTIKILSEILEEDTVNTKGQRTLEEGIKSKHIPEILIGFEGNKNRPLHQVLKTPLSYDSKENTIRIPAFNLKEHLQWPSEEATQVQFQMATANWNAANDTFETCYGEEIIREKNQKSDLVLKTQISENSNWKIVFLYIGFAIQERRKIKPLHRKHNTVTIIACFKI